MHLDFSTICVKRDEFDFYIINFPFLDSDVSRRPSYGVYTCISQLMRFALASSRVGYHCVTSIVVTKS